MSKHFFWLTCDMYGGWFAPAAWKMAPYAAAAMAPTDRISTSENARNARATRLGSILTD